MNARSIGGRIGTVAAVIIVTILLTIGGWLTSLLTPYLMPSQASTQAQEVDALMRFMMFIGGMIFLLVQGTIIWAVIFYRRREGDDSDGPNVHGNYALEFVWTLIPTIIVFVITIYSYSVWVSTRAPQENEQVVQIQAQRYAFAFEYFDQASGVNINDNVLRTYVGRPVRLEMSAVDVIHSVWLPEMRVKQDMLPGRDTELRFTPIEAGRYRLVCTELCGGGHGGMQAEVLVYPDEESYMTWNDTVVECALNPPEDPVVRGKDILASGRYPCNGCHVLDDLPTWAGIVGPSLNGIGERAVGRAEAAGDASAEEYINLSIRNPSAYIVPGYQAVMPAFNEDQMSDEELEAITAYLLAQGGDAPEIENTCPVPDFDTVIAQYEDEQAVASR